MSTASPSISQLRAHVKRQLKRWEPGKAIAVRSAARWLGSDGIEVEGKSFRIAWCEGPLELRQQLSDVQDADGLVLMTPLDGSELGHDVLARLAGGRVDGLRAWDVAQELFRAKQIDPQLLGHRWMADAIVAASEHGEPDPVTTGVLDLETAWRYLLRRLIDWQEPSIDLQSLLRWSLGSSRLQMYGSLEPSLKDCISKELRTRLGKGGEFTLHAVDAGFGADLVAIGLACEVIFPPDGTSLQPAIVRLERYLLDRTIDRPAAAAWAQASTKLLSELDRAGDKSSVDEIIRGAERLIAELRAESHWIHSSVLPRGLDARVAHFSNAVDAALKSPGSTAVIDLEDRLKLIEQHSLASRRSERVDRVRMAARLTRWLCQTTAIDASADLFEVSRTYLNDERFVDWARSGLAGEELPGFAEVLGRLADAVASRREATNQHFAACLADFTKTGTPRHEIPGVESVLDCVVAPLAEHLPVLMVVLDGMSQSVLAELGADITRNGWKQVTNDASRLRAALSTIPSVTEFARTSLLRGALASGNQDSAVAGFSSHPRLIALSGKSSSPLLFHKAELMAGEDLAPDLRRSIVSPECRIVAVVVNAVDDYLSKGDQVRARWTVDYIKALRPLLHAAAEANRALVLASDHGHVLHRDAVFAQSDRGERWRSARGQPARDGEVLLQGERVLADGGQLIAAWSERIYFNNKKHGYHGGASPQEMLASLTTMLPSQLPTPSGWQDCDDDPPIWWNDVGVTEAVIPAIEVKPGTTSKSATATTRSDGPTLFDLEPTGGPAKADGSTSVRREVAPTDQQSSTEPAWIGELLRSPTFSRQRAAAARTPLDDDKLRSFLAVLAARGGTMLRPALAAATKVPLLRLPGVLATLRRLLNIDGIDILIVDDIADSVTLDINRLRHQFELAE